MRRYIKVSKKLKRLQDKAQEKGWDLIKIKKGNYRLWLIGEKHDISKEVKFSLSDVAFFLGETSNNDIDQLQ